VTPGAWLWLVRRDVLSQRARLGILIACITLSASLFGLAFAAIMFLHAEIRPRLRAMFPESRVIVRPSSSDIFLFKLEGPKIGEPEFQALRAMPEIAKIYRQMPAAFPVSAEFSMESLGGGFVTDIIMFGVDRDLVAKNIVIPGEFPPSPTDREPVPALISEYFVDAYNLGLAESSGLPKLSRSALLGVEFDILLGESTIGLAPTAAKPRTVRARIVGITPNPLLFGVMIPVETMAEFNRAFSAKAEGHYSVLHLDLASPEGAEAVRLKAESLKLRFEAQKDVLDRYLRIVTTLEGILWVGLATVLSLAAVGVFTTTAAAIRERRAAWGLHRATGLSRGGVLVLAAGHALAAAIPSMIAATLIVLGASRALSGSLASFAELSILPANPFAFSPWVALAICAFSLLFAAIPSLIFTLPIARARPVALLAERSL